MVALALRGDSLPRFSTPDGELPVRIRYRPEDRSGLEELSDFSVPTRGGSAVRLSSLTELSYLSSEPAIWRVDKRMSQTLTFELEPDGPEVVQVQRHRCDPVEASHGDFELLEYGACTAPGGPLDGRVVHVKSGCPSWRGADSDGESTP